MKDHPIIFSGPMVRAILAGTKTQTRRVIKMRDGSLCEDEDIPAYEGARVPYVMDFSKTFPRWQQLDCPHGVPGDSLWVREKWKCEELPENGLDGVRYAADNSFIEIENTREASELWGEANRPGGKWRPSIFMPHWASRIALVIVNVRVERVQEISVDDIYAEGCRPISSDEDGSELYEWYSDLWDSINLKRGCGWEVNPYCWCLTFKKLEVR